MSKPNPTIDISDEVLGTPLIELLERYKASDLILAGGFGLRIRKKFLDTLGVETVFSQPTELRATTDIDLFLCMQIWMNANGAKAPFRDCLSSLGYEVRNEHWKFAKKHEGSTNMLVLDLMAREPRDGEAVKVKSERVGVGQDAKLHGKLTPEGFAIEESPISIVLKAGPGTCTVKVAHPYAYLNLKVAAANDWMRELAGELKAKEDREGNRLRLKHVADVYAIVGMMTERELFEAVKLAKKFASEPKPKDNLLAATQLYGTKEAPGSQAIRNNQNGEWTDHFDENYELFWDTLRTALGAE